MGLAVHGQRDSLHARSAPLYVLRTERRSADYRSAVKIPSRRTALAAHIDDSCLLAGADGRRRFDSLAVEMQGDGVRERRHQVALVDCLYAYLIVTGCQHIFGYENAVRLQIRICRQVSSLRIASVLWTDDICACTALTGMLNAEVITHLVRRRMVVCGIVPLDENTLRGSYCTQVSGGLRCYIHCS